MRVSISGLALSGPGVVIYPDFVPDVSLPIIASLIQCPWCRTSFYVISASVINYRELTCPGCARCRDESNPSVVTW
jgi:hypothetical protein